jgi:hypothetical protein
MPDLDRAPLLLGVRVPGVQESKLPPATMLWPFMQTIELLCFLSLEAYFLEIGQWGSCRYQIVRSGAI